MPLEDLKQVVTGILKADKTEVDAEVAKPKRARRKSGQPQL